MNTNPSQLAFDPRALERILGPNPQKHRLFLEKFLGSAARGLSELESSVVARSAESVSRGAHKLKSSASAVGANAMATALEQLEVAARLPDWSSIDALMHELAAALRTVEAHVAAARS